MLARLGALCRTPIPRREEIRERRYRSPRTRSRFRVVTPDLGDEPGFFACTSRRKSVVTGPPASLANFSAGAFVPCGCAELCSGNDDMRIQQSQIRRAIVATMAGVLAVPALWAVAPPAA